MDKVRLYVHLVEEMGKVAKMMKSKKNALVFFSVALINLVLSVLLYVCNSSALIIEDVVKDGILYIFSLVLYWFLYFVFSIKSGVQGKTLLPIPYLVFSLMGIIVFGVNVKNDPFLFFPMMYLVSIFGVSLYWEFLRGDKEKDGGME